MARSPIGACSGCSWSGRPPVAGGSANSMKRWSTSRGSAMSSHSGPRVGASKTSRTTASSSHPHSASPAVSRSGRAMGWAAPPSWARPWAPSSARCRPVLRMRHSTGCAPAASTNVRSATSYRSSPTRRSRRGMFRPTRRCWSSGSATNSATGGSSCTRLLACRCIRRGPWP